MSEAEEDDNMREEYDFRGGVRGKYAGRLAGTTKVVTLDPDVAEFFDDAASVNNALRELIQRDAVPKNPGQR